ncbi:MAG: alpha/beta hydrolase [Bifidobacteriaceae bacterium]|jgi:pimeloyl-ACP methyl ester carboxylesterase|nr:alpha/beta hydrolase [Bifidobacteriaceae bacterium]
MTILAVRAGGALRGAARLDQPLGDPWGQDDETSRFSAAERAQERSAGPLVPAGTVPLVLLHAFPLSSAMWGPVLADLPELPVLAIDLPGAGFSPTVQPVSIRAAGLAVIESLAELGVTRAVIGGISMGGYVAMSVIKDAPELLAGAILMHTKAVADDPATRAGRLETARQVLHAGSTELLAPMASKMVSAASQIIHPGLVETIEHWIDQATPGGMAWAEEAMAGRDDAMGTLRACGLPVTIMAGAADPFATVRQAEEMADAVGHSANLAVLSEIAHLSPLEAPNMTSRIVRESYRRMVD